MPSKKKKVEPLDEAAQVELDKATEKADKIKYCGHINRHYIDPNGKLVDLKCDLAPGHKGDHSAPCERNMSEQVVDNKNVVIETKWTVVPALAYWNDSAGRPVAEIQSDVVVEMTGYQKDLVMDVLKRNPMMDVETATAKAKMQENWNIQKRA